jgi:hypothetical protein
MIQSNQQRIVDVLLAVIRDEESLQHKSQDEKKGFENGCNKTPLGVKFAEPERENDHGGGLSWGSTIAPSVFMAASLAISLARSSAGQFEPRDGSAPSP